MSATVGFMVLRLVCWHSGAVDGLLCWSRSIKAMRWNGSKAWAIAIELRSRMPSGNSRIRLILYERRRRWYKVLMGDDKWSDCVCFCVCLMRGVKSTTEWWMWLGDFRFGVRYLSARGFLVSIRLCWMTPQGIFVYCLFTYVSCGRFLIYLNYCYFIQ